MNLKSLRLHQRGCFFQVCAQVLQKFEWDCVGWHVYETLVSQHLQTLCYHKCYQQPLAPREKWHSKFTQYAYYLRFMQERCPKTDKNKISNSSMAYLLNFDNPYVKVQLACKICDKPQNIKRPDTWKRHFLTHEADSNKPHKCDICGKAVVTSSQLKNHMQTHYRKMAKDASGNEQIFH